MNNLFFDPPQLEVLYALTHLDGRQRCDALKIERIHYVSLEKANKWLEKVITDLHTCYISGHPAFQAHGQAAHDQLFKLWSRMTDKDIEDYPYPATVSWYTPPVSENALLQASLEGMVESLAMGRTDVSTVKEMIQEQFCQPTFNEGAFAEYFKLTYGQCPDRLLFVGQDRLVVNRMAHAFSQEFNSAQTGGSGRGMSYFSVDPVMEDCLLESRFDGPEPYYLQVIPSINHLIGFTSEVMEVRITRRLIMVDIQDSPFTFNDLTYALNFFEQAKYKPLALVILASEPLPIDGPTIYC